jgi:hypothetical protein
LSDAYESAYEQTRVCDPTAPAEQCTTRISYGLECGQDVFINGKQTDARIAMEGASEDYAAQGCLRAVTCGASANPIGANCSEAGVCETVYDNGGRGCKVDGVVYAHGAQNIPSPTDCNTCSCDDGQLACTELGCPNECPTGTDGGSQCALCGPTDACQVVEYGCFPQCDTASDCNPSEACVSNRCVSGICG